MRNSFKAMMAIAALIAAFAFPALADDGQFVGNELSRPFYGSVPITPAAYYTYDMFPVNNDPMPYRPNYVAPPAPPPTPPMTYVDNDSGNYCREFSQKVRVNNHVQEIYGTACLQPDGSWHIVQ